MMISLGGKPLLTPEVLRAIINPIWICLGDQTTADRQYSEDVAGFFAERKVLLLKNTSSHRESFDWQTNRHRCNVFTKRTGFVP